MFSKKLSTIAPIRRILSIRNSSTTINIENLEKDSNTVDVIDEEAQQREAEIERKRNKSRLRDADRQFLFEQNPYPEPTHWAHGTLKYLRRSYGRYGADSGVDPAICWPVKQELDDAIEYERVAYPFTIPQMIEDARRKRSEENERTRVRQEEIVKKMEKLDEWKRQLAEKIAKKEKEALAARERKERLMEEVRMHFGYTVDPRDERFKELLEKKEKEQKKAMKEARKKAREEAMLAKMLSKRDNKSIEDKKGE